MPIGMYSRQKELAVIKRLLVRLALAAVGLLLAAGPGAALASSSNALYIEDRKTGLDLWTEDGVVYAPAKELADRMGWQLAYDGDSGRIAVSNKLGDKLAFRPGESEVTFNGKTYDIAQTVRLRSGSAYVPLRILAEAMHAGVHWQPGGEATVVQAADPYTVAEGDTLAGIAEAHGTSVQALMARNGLAKPSLVAGQTLKVIVPEFLDPETADAALLAKLVQVEAGYEPYEGKLAVANVVLNRVKSGRFPDTVRGVIYARGQFPPALNGDLKTVSASADSLKAAKAALAGENNVPGALYFFNPKREPDKAKTADLVREIGHHMFVK